MLDLWLFERNLGIFDNPIGEKTPRGLEFWFGRMSGACVTVFAPYPEDIPQVIEPLVWR
jgi:hypothetical protein